MSHMRFVYRFFCRLSCAVGAPWAIAPICALCVATAGAAGSRPASMPTSVPTSMPASAPTSAPTTASAPAKARSLSEIGLRDDRPRALPVLAGDDHDGFLGRMLAYVGVALVLGLGAVFVAKRYLPRMAPRGGERIHVVDSAYLGPRKQVHVLEVGAQRFLVASCRDSVTMISELARSFSEVYEENK